MKAALWGVGWVTSGGWGRGRDGSPFVWERGPIPRLVGHPALSGGVARAGRMDEFTRLGFVAISQALEDAGLSEGRARGPIGALASSSFGCLHTDMEYFATVLPNDGRLASPNLFAYTLPNCFLGEAAIRYGLTGPSFVVSETEPSGLEPIRLALETIGWGECPSVVAGTCDLPPPAGTGAPPCLPPGAVFLVLGEGPGASSAPYGEVMLGSDGALLWGQTPVRNLGELVAEVLRARPARRPRPGTPRPAVIP